MATRAGQLLAFLTVALLISGCGGTATPGSVTAPPPSLTAPARSAADSVGLTVSGGFAGVRRGIEVRPGGKVFVTDRKGGRASRDLSDTEQKRLGSLLGAVDFAALPARSISESSRDRFEYRLVHDGRAVVTDGSKDLGAADDLIAHLESCLSARG
ncbi:hypothetical protein ACFPK5_03900 [Streptomyces beijiangensis]|uniref:hypothetical protein n=1 Tax=Streptomyces beijiangensis TaxID=163361 RepID=UPI0031D7A7CA